MNTQQIIDVLVNTYNPNEVERKRAEATLDAARYAPGVSTALLQICTIPEAPRDVRQSASLALKMAVKRHWTELDSTSPWREEGQPPNPTICDQDKATLRAQMLEVVCRESDNSIAEILIESMGYIVREDFPEKWGELLPMVLVKLKTMEPLAVLNSLKVLRKLVKKFEYRKASEGREPLNEMISQTFPLLLELTNYLLNSDSEEAAHVVHWVLKVYWSCTQYTIPNVAQDPQVVTAWMESINKILMKDVPDQMLSKEEDEREQHGWWKAKKWACHIIARFFSRFGIVKFADGDHKEFAKFFGKEIAATLLRSCLHLLQLPKNGRYCSPRVTHLSLAFVERAIELKNTWLEIKPHLDFLLFECVYPLLCPTKKDVDLFHEDPHEFVRKQHDVMEDFISPQMAAQSLVRAFAQYKPKTTLQKMLDFLTNVLNGYQTLSPEHKAQQSPKKDGALLFIGVLHESLFASEKFSAGIEGMMNTHVFPEFDSPLPFLRMRAAWMCKIYSAAAFNPESRVIIVTKLMCGLKDATLPVQIQAAESLRFIIDEETFHVVLEELLVPNLTSVLTEYFRLMNEIGNDAIVSALECIIDAFPEQVIPHAGALAAQLASVFQRYMTASDDDDDTGMAALQCMDAMNTLLHVLRDHREMYAELEPVMVPVMRYLLSNPDCFEYYEQAHEMLGIFTHYRPEPLTEELWGLFIITVDNFELQAMDMIDAVSIPLENFIHRGKHIFVQGRHPQTGVPFPQMVIEMVTKLIQADGQTEIDSKKAFFLLMSMVHNCKGMIDQFMPLIIQLCLSRLTPSETSPVIHTDRLKATLLMVLASAFNYNPVLTLQVMEHAATGQVNGIAPNCTAQVFEQWFKMLTPALHEVGKSEDDDLEKPFVPFESMLSKKLTILGLTALLHVPFGQLPVCVKENMSQMFSANLILIERLRAQQLENENEEIDDEGIDEDNIEDVHLDGMTEFDDEDADVDNEEDMAYLENLKKLRNRQYDDMAMEMYDDEEDEDQIFTSEIDHVDEVIYLSDTLNLVMSQPEGSGTRDILYALPPQSRQKVQEVIQLGNQRRMEKAEKQAQEQQQR